jgi:hypothetical protein
MDGQEQRRWCTSLDVHQRRAGRTLLWSTQSSCLNLNFISYRTTCSTNRSSQHHIPHLEGARRFYTSSTLARVSSVVLLRFFCFTGPEVTSRFVEKQILALLPFRISWGELARVCCRSEHNSHTSLQGDKQSGASSRITSEEQEHCLHIHSRICFIESCQFMKHDFNNFTVRGSPTVQSTWWVQRRPHVLSVLIH